MIRNKGMREMTSDIPRIAIFHPLLREGGGSEAAALRAAEALEADHDVTLVTMGCPDIGRLNGYYGTHLDADRTRVVSFAVPAFATGRFAALRAFRAARYCRQNASQFDLMISTYNVMDFGVRGIQFIADLSFDDALRSRDKDDPGTFFSVLRRGRIVRGPYLALARALARASKNGWKRNLTIANSDWTARALREAFGIESLRIYPPVADMPSGLPWEEREDGFVYLGRVSPEKDIESIIAILKAVREDGFDIHLHIVGQADDPAYMSKLTALALRNAEWVFLEGPKGGRDKAAFVGRHRYGMSARWNEPFGISVAELVKAGCLVWVPASGGQTEIVERPDLIYSDRADAVRKIESALKSSELQAAILAHLAARKETFSVGRFAKEVRSVVADFLGDRGGGGAS